MAYGLGLIYGVLRIVNLNHGGMIMAGAYAGWYLHVALGLDPYLSLLLVSVGAYFVGIATYLLFPGNDQTLRTSYSTLAIGVGGALLSVNRIAVFAVAIVILIVLHLLLT